MVLPLEYNHEQNILDGPYILVGEIKHSTWKRLVIHSISPVLNKFSWLKTTCISKHILASQSDTLPIFENQAVINKLTSLNTL